MNFRTITLGLVSLISSSTLAMADLSGGYVFGSNQSTVRCMLFNAGNTTVTVSKARIVDSDGKAITLTTNTCDVAIGPGKGCLIAGPAGQFARACKFSTSAGDLRGSLVMYDSTDKPWQSIDLQQ